MVRVLLSLPALELRVNWLNDHFARCPPRLIAATLEEICARNERSEPDAREACLAVACCFAAQGDSSLVRRLRALAATRHLLSLGRMLPEDSRPSGPPQVLTDVPDYGTGRELTVGERRTLARRPSRGHLERLLADPHPLVLREVLLNRFLTEDDVLRLAARRPAHVVALEALARSSNWLRRRRVRLAIVQNPGTPAGVARPLLVVCNRNELSQIVDNTSVPLNLRSTAQELLAMRPPLKRDALTDGVLQ